MKYRSCSSGRSGSPPPPSSPRAPPPPPPPPPAAAPGQGHEVAPITVEVQEIRIEVADAQVHAVHSIRLILPESPDRSPPLEDLSQLEHRRIGRQDVQGAAVRGPRGGIQRPRQVVLHRYHGRIDAGLLSAQGHD